MLYIAVKRNRGGLRSILFELPVHAGCTTLRGEEDSSAHILLKPIHEELGNFSAILFGHELVTIPAYPYIFELHVRGTDPFEIKESVSIPSERSALSAAKLQARTHSLFRVPLYPGPRSAMPGRSPV